MKCFLSTIAILAYGPQHVHYVNIEHICCITSKDHPSSVRKGLFAGVVSEHQHLASLINLKSMWQPQCTSNSGLLVHQGASTCLHYMNTEHICGIISKVHSASIRKGLFAGVMSEYQHLVAFINFWTVWQPQCTSNFGLLGYQGAFSMSTLCKHWTHAVLFPKSILYQSEKFYVQEWWVNISILLL